MMKIINKNRIRKRIVLYSLGVFVLYIAYGILIYNADSIPIGISNNTNGKIPVIVYFDDEVVFNDSISTGFAPHYVYTKFSFGFHKVIIKRGDDEKIIKVNTFFSLPIWNCSENKTVEKYIFVSNFTKEISIDFYENKEVTVESIYYQRTFI